MSTAVPNRSASHATVSQRRFLLVDDSVTLRKLISSLLSQSFGAVTMAADGDEAVKLAMEAQEQGQPFDLILMDVVMPHLNGCEATFQLRQAGYRGKIIILTAADREFDQARVLCAGANDFLPKPFGPEELARVVKQHLS
ncbi:MAG: response regulator [Phycisphaeraceae bacterium]|nr:response regulator [Phycisphaeraceae bacterium]